MEDNYDYAFEEESERFSRIWTGRLINIFKNLKKKESKVEPNKIYCSFCGEEINDSIISVSGNGKEMYHKGECVIGNTALISSLCDVEPLSITYRDINRSEAIKLKENQLEVIAR